MYTIFLLECKKALSNRKNRFSLILYCALLFVFVLQNDATFSDARERELEQLSMLPVRISNAANTRWMTTVYNAQWIPAPGFEDDFNLITQAATNSYHTLRRMEIYAQQMTVAMKENDRTTEIIFLNYLYRAHLEQYLFAYNILGVPQPIGLFYLSRCGHNIPLDYNARIAFYRENQEFIQYFVDNDILFLYENEMRGINFIYQALRQLLPLAVLFIVFIVASDTFTSDNQWGSYKFLLVNPISRKKVFISKLIAACTIAFALVLGPVIVLGLALGVMNGFGPYNYPILTQMGTYATFTPLQNNLAFDQTVGNFLWRLLEFTQMEQAFASTGLAYVPEHPALGLTPITSHVLFENYLFTPNPALQYTPMLLVIFMALPLYLLVILVAVSAIALLSVLFQHSIPVLIIGVIFSIGAILFPAPVSNISLLARLNPFIYVNPINILNGVGSTTALMGVVVLALWSVVLTILSLFLFTKRDIRC
ncbi:MAG: ABC transporter permease subunit [Defluviitaleaceae bacterium]|nr:ABC transporter permease subunit [Defluviitaleaceae bacterium]MCL2240514.1 ABC transporter permease subunit [Defluviitaleaceae bacterium]